MAAAFRLQGQGLLTAAEAFGPLPGGASPPPASQLAVTAGAPAAVPTMGGRSGASVPAAVQRAAGYERAEAAAADAPGQREAAVHRRGGSESLYPVTPAAQPPMPPMARFPVTESQYTEGQRQGAKV